MRERATPNTVGAHSSDRSCRKASSRCGSCADGSHAPTCLNRSKEILPLCELIISGKCGGEERTQKKGRSQRTKQHSEGSDHQRQMRSNHRRLPCQISQAVLKALEWHLRFALIGCPSDPPMQRASGRKARSSLSLELFRTAAELPFASRPTHDQATRSSSARQLAAGSLFLLKICLRNRSLQAPHRSWIGGAVAWPADEEASPESWIPILGIAQVGACVETDTRSS